jgi:8-oxo-dGTP diphosphatase
MKNQEENFRKIVADLRIAIAAVDVALFTIIDNALHTFLIPVDRPPFYKNMFGLPGGIIGENETADEAAERHLKNKAHLENIHIEQLYTFSDPSRDKRSRSISVAYMALVPPNQVALLKENKENKWVRVNKLPKLAYDHEEIMKVAIDRLKGKLIYTNIASKLLAKHFTLTELQNTYEIILGRELDKRNFRKKMLSIGLIKEVGKQKQTLYRPAALYTFTKQEIITIPEVHAAL